MINDGRLLIPNHIKLNIEWSELLALKGAENVLTKNHLTIFLSTHGELIHSQCCKSLQKLGQSVELTDEGASHFGELYAYKT